MITIQKVEHTESYRGKQENNYINVELRGLSTDTKPTTINGENIDNHTKRDKQLLNMCYMDDDTIRVFLNYFKTLTDQDSDKKTLKFLGFMKANCNKAVLLDEWQDLVDAGWTTGY